MLSRFGLLYHLSGLSTLLARIGFLDESVDRLRTTHREGPTAYVMLHRSQLDYLAFNAALNARRLPRAAWANDISTLLWRPLPELLRSLGLTLRLRRLSRATIAGGDLKRIVHDGRPVTIFLRADSGGPDPLAALVEAQLERPEERIALIPVVVMWDRSPEREGALVERFLLGSRERPSTVQRLRNLLLRSGTTFVQVGEAIDLREVCSRVAEPRRAPVLRALLRRRLKLEAQLVRGPRLLPVRVMRDLVLDNPPMRALARAEAERLGKPVTTIERRMEREFQAIAAHMRWWVTMVASVVLRPFWTRVFSGVDVPTADMTRLRDAMRSGSVVLVPCHKSHFDYVLVTWVLFANNLVIPHVVAGMNLAIPVLQYFLRSLGGFFIKRSFARETLHPAIFERYFRELVLQENPIEFFIEGGRTRSGRLLPPRLGVLEMVLRAAELRDQGREVTILPIGLAYEQVAEEAAFARELGGAEKVDESLGQVARATHVFLRRFGRVYLRVGEPIVCSEVVDASDTAPSWSQRTDEDRASALRGLGQRIMIGIGSAIVTLPSALVSMALLAHHRRAVRHEDLMERVSRFQRFLLARGLDEAASLQNLDGTISKTLQRFTRSKTIEELDLADGRVWAAIPSQRMTLDFYKNQSLHAFAPAGLVVCALRGLPDEPQPTEAILPRVTALRSLLRREFLFARELTDEQLVADGLEHLTEYGALLPSSAGWIVASERHIGEMYGLFRSILESYRLVARESAGLAEGEPRALARAFQRRSETWISAGLITRPEALALVTLRHAIKTFLEDEVLRVTSGSIGSGNQAETLALLEPMVD